MLHAIPEVDADLIGGGMHAHPLSDGSLSDPKSDPLLAAPQVATDSGRGEHRGGGDMFSPARGAGARGSGVPSGADSEVSEEGLRELLGMVDAERARMSKAVLSSADGLTNAVTIARKRLSASIAQVEEQLQEEQRLLDAAPGPGAPLPETAKLSGPEVVVALEAQLTERDSELELQRAEVRRLEEERDLYRSQAREPPPFLALSQSSWAYRFCEPGLDFGQS